MTPAYEKLSTIYPDTFIAEQQGSFYRCYEDSAYILHGILGFKLNISDDGTVHAGFPIAQPERALMALEDNHISYKLFHGEEAEDSQDFEDNRFNEFRKMYSGKDKPIKTEKKKENIYTYPVPGEEKKRQHASVFEGMGTDMTTAMNDMLARVEKNILNKGLRVEAVSTVTEERNGAVKVTGIVIHS